MTVHKICMWLVAGLLLSTTSTAARGQVNEWVNTPAHDLQFYSPVDFDFDNRPIGRESGYFFRYDKLSWAMTGERNTVGDPDVEVFSEIIAPEGLADLGGISTGPLPQQGYPIINGLQDVAPTAQFAWGERYEMGLFDGDSGWELSILDGPFVSTQNTFGNGPEDSGFGSIHVNFATPTDFLLGWRDYWGTGVEQDGFIPATPTLSGPGGVGDGVVDDLDGDGFDGPIFIIDAMGTTIGIVIDFDDLHLFNVTFNQVTVRNSTETQGVELMRTHRLTNRHKMTKHQGNNLDIAYGVRFLRLRDEFSFDGTSDLLGTAFFTTGAENQIVGPQIRTRWSRQRGRWNLGIDGRFLFGYNITDLDQTGAIGLDNVDAAGVTVQQGLVPGAIDRFLSGQPTAFSYGKQENEFSPVVELRADLSYQVTGAISARLGYTEIFVDNISRASQVTRYFLPDMGFLESGKQEIFINGVNFGFDVVY